MSDAAPSATPERLRMTGIAKSFGRVRVLDDVHLAVRPGEVVALLGANGAGKSTLMKILTGAYSRNGGTIELDGRVVDMTSPRDAGALGISFLPQEVSVIPDMTVADNIGLATLSGERSFGLAAVDDRKARSRATEILGDLGFGHIAPETFVGDLSVAEQRIVEIARALATDASILVMDEPTASLSEQESETIFEIIRRLKVKRTSVVYISHYLKEVFAISDRIEVLRDGRNAGSFRTAETTVASVVEAMLGKAAGHLFDASRMPSAATPPVLAVRDLGWKDKLDGISLAIGRGEIVGAFGLVGSGVEVLGRVIFGAEGGGYAGGMTMEGRPFHPASPAQAKAAGLGFVTAERKTDGILADLSLRENLVAPFQTRYGTGPFVSRTRETAFARSWIDKLGIRTAGPEQAIRYLSGGNQQKACVARWLHPSVKLLILEEPTRGVDLGARRDIYRHLVDFARDGLAILVLSSDVEEIAGLCDRSLVIDRGRVVATFPAGTDASALMAATAGDHRAELADGGAA